jgi:hypothetical protein
MLERDVREMLEKLKKMLERYKRDVRWMFERYSNDGARNAIRLWDLCSRVGLVGLVGLEGFVGLVGLVG